MKRSKLFLVLGLMLALALTGCGKEEGTSTGTGGTGTGAGETGAGGAAAVMAVTPKTAPVAHDLGMLVPADAAALVYMASPKDFEAKVQDFVKGIDPDAAEDLEITKQLSEMLPGLGEYWDTSKPCALAVSLPPEGVDPGRALNRGQGICFILAMTDVAAAQAAIDKELGDAPADQRPAVRVSGSYMAFTPTPDTVWGESVPAIAKTAPEGDVAIRIDLATVVTRFRKEIDEGLSQMEKEMNRGAARGGAPGGAQAFGKMFSSIAGGMRDFVESAETLELGATMNASTVDLLVGFTAKEGSKLDIANPGRGDLAALAGHLPEGMQAHILMRMDYEKLMEWLGPMMDAIVEAMPEEMKKAGFKEIMAESMDMSKLLGPNYAIALGVNAKGFQLVELVDVKDGKTYLERMEKLVDREFLPGLAVTKGASTKVKGIDVHSYEMKLDLAKLMEMQGGGAEIPPEIKSKVDAVMQRLFGGKLDFQMAVVKNQLVMAMGDEKLMADMIGSLAAGRGKVPAALAQAMDKAGGTPSFLIQVELRSLVKEVLAAVREIADEEDIPTAPEGGPLPIMLWGKHAGRHYGGGLSVDVGGIVEMFQAMDR